MSENLFTAFQLATIIKEATKNEKRYLDTLVVRGNTTPISISTISAEKRLIFTEGNEHSGYQHLSDRHAHFRYKNYWVKTDDGQIKLDRPSKFDPDMAPIIEFRKIADTIFCPENKNITKNTRPDMFDKFTGYYSYKDQKPEKYHLLTYRGTRVVHTMFPDKKKHNLKAVAKFGKGHVTVTRKLTEDYADLLVPYENNAGKMAYSILIRKFYLEQVERVFIQQHDEKGNVESLFLLGEREINDFNSFDHPMMAHFQHRDLVDYERIINQMAAGAETIEINLETFRW